MVLNVFFKFSDISTKTFFIEVSVFLMNPFFNTAVLMRLQDL